MGELGWHAPYDWIHHIAVQVADAVKTAHGFVEWAVTAAFDGVFGLLLGFALIPVATKVIVPLWEKVTGKKPADAH